MVHIFEETRNAVQLSSNGSEKSGGGCGLTMVLGNKSVRSTNLDNSRSKCLQ